MRFNVDRICELAGIGAASGGLLSEGAAPAKVPAAPAAPAAKAPPPAAPVQKGPVKAAADKMTEDDDDLPGDLYSYGDPEDIYDLDEESDPYAETYDSMLEDDAEYEIDEMELAEALIGMRQNRLEEASVRDTVRDEIQRALADRSGSWVYGSNRPTASRLGQVSRGGFGIGFKR